MCVHGVCMCVWVSVCVSVCALRIVLCGQDFALYKYCNYLLLVMLRDIKTT